MLKSLQTVEQMEMTVNTTITNAPRFIDANTCHELLDYAGLVEALRDLFHKGVDRLEAWRLQQPLPNGDANDWIFLPAWQFDRYKGVKLVSVYPNNHTQGLASVQGLYVLFDARNGLPLLCIDGAALTLRKTAANSALAATYLARQDASTLLMVGAGALAPHLIAAHAAVRPIKSVMIWNRNEEKAHNIAQHLALPTVSATVVTDLKDAVGRADIISCATMSREPLIKGSWLQRGTHLDLVGGYMPEMREADDECVQRSRVFVDTRITTAHAGDIYQPIASGVLTEDTIVDTFELARGDNPGRVNDEEITLFKSAGGGHEDLGTAVYLLARLKLE